MNRRHNIHPRIPETGSATAPQEKATSTRVSAKTKKQQEKQQAASVTGPPVTSTPVTSTPAAAPRSSTGPANKTSNKRLSQETTRSDHQEAGTSEQGSSGLQEPQRKKVAKEIHEQLMMMSEHQTEGHEGASEEETETKLQLVAKKREMIQLQRRLAVKEKNRKALRLKETTQELTSSMNNSLAMGLSVIEQEFEETERRLREVDAGLQDQEVTIISLDDSQDEVAMIEFEQGVHDVDDDEEDVDEAVTMDDLTNQASTKMAAKKPAPRK